MGAHWQHWFFHCYGSMRVYVETGVLVNWEAHRLDYRTAD